MTVPFDYPDTPLERRHGPQGYSDSASYIPWLRDEFCFRCVYCLMREQWSRHATLTIDHFSAASQNPDLSTDYDNLLYACATCNGAKGNRKVPAPTSALLKGVVVVHEDGTIYGQTAETRRLIELLGHDGSQSSEFRLLWIGIIALSAQYDVALYRRLMGFPDDLPDLGRLRPPGGNQRADGIETTWFRRRHENSIPDTY